LYGGIFHTISKFAELVTNSAKVHKKSAETVTKMDIIWTITKQTKKPWHSPAKAFSR